MAETNISRSSDYSIKEAAALVGRSELTIRRRIEKGRFPGAELRRGSSGDEWAIPADDLLKVAQEDGWSIIVDLTDDQAPDRSSDQPTSDIFAAMEAKFLAESEIKLLSKDVQALTEQKADVINERDQARRDLEYTRAELDQTTAALAEQAKATAVAEARVEELRQRVEYAEKLRVEVVQERDSLDQQHRQLVESSAETISELSSELEFAENQRSRTADVRNLLVQKVAEVEASVGWIGRRRIGKRK